MSEEIFADAIGEITVTGSVVRVDLMTMAVNDRDEEGRLKPVFTQRVIFPIEGFAHATEAMLHMRNQLEERGILTRQDASEPQVRFTDFETKGQPN